MDNKKEVGQRINAALAMRDKKQKELAHAIGVTDNTISYFCSGSRTPNLQQIIAIAKELNVSSDYLLGLSNTPSVDEDMQVACKMTGLSEKAISRLREASEYIRANPPGFIQNAYDVLLSVDGPEYTLQPEGKKVSASEVFYVSLSNYLHERSTEVGADMIADLDEETHEELLSLQKRLAVIGYTVTPKQTVTSTMLQDACDALRALFQEYGDNMRGGSDNGKH